MSFLDLLKLLGLAVSVLYATVQGVAMGWDLMPDRVKQRLLFDLSRRCSQAAAQLSFASMWLEQQAAALGDDQPEGT